MKNWLKSSEGEDKDVEKQVLINNYGDIKLKTPHWKVLWQ